MSLYHSVCVSVCYQQLYVCVYHACLCIAAVIYAIKCGSNLTSEGVFIK